MLTRQKFALNFQGQLNRKVASRGNHKYSRVNSALQTFVQITDPIVVLTMDQIRDLEIWLTICDLQFNLIVDSCQ